MRVWVSVYVFMHACMYVDILVLILFVCMSLCVYRVGVRRRLEECVSKMAQGVTCHTFMGTSKVREVLELMYNKKVHCTFCEI